MRRSLLLAAFLLGAALSVQPAAATVALTAVEGRVGDHPGFVRVVIEFSDGDLSRFDPTLLDAEPWRDGRTRLELAHRGVRTELAPFTADGVSIRTVQGTDRIVVRLSSNARRFKYVSYLVLASPERLVIDLWKARPPALGAHIRDDGCLRLSSWSVGDRTAGASGRALRQLFEGTLVVRVRNAAGALLAEKPLIANRKERWQAMLRIAVAKSQPGTLEAVVGSAKDGSLECLVQVRVRLHP